jgi:hypothetical protein
MIRFHLIILFFLAGFLVGCDSNGVNLSTDLPIKYQCSAENRVQDEFGNWIFKDDSVGFKGGETQSGDCSFSGSYSIKLDSVNPYSAGITLKNIRKGEFFSASVWQKSGTTGGELLCVFSGNSATKLGSRENGFYEHKKGWFKHQLQFNCAMDFDSITFFLFVGGSSELTYFDELEIQRFTNRPKSEENQERTLSIYLPDSSENLLDTIIKNTLNAQIINEDSKEYLNGFICQEEDSIPIELRLKGDWTDHLISGSPSYRIKTGEDKTFDGLSTFSIQHPKTRNFIHEWLLHKICEQEGLLATKYEFLTVELNGQNQGTYAIEEHFDKQLLERQKRREAPILKMDETGFWAQTSYKLKENREIEFPYYEAAIITCFKEGRTFKSPVLTRQFLDGATLLAQFKEGSARPEQIFDLEKIATYYALMDLGNVNHSLKWHNRRFYYNPITTKLEDIGFDMSPMVMPFNPLFATSIFKRESKFSVPEDRIHHQLFMNDEFRKFYIEKLKKFSNDKYLIETLLAIKEEIANAELFIQKEIPNYTFDPLPYFQKAALIRKELETLDQRWDIYLSQQPSYKTSLPQDSVRYIHQTNPPLLKEIAVNAYKSVSKDSTYKIEFENFFLGEIEVIGYSLKTNKDSLIRFQKSIFLPAFNPGMPAVSNSIQLSQEPARYFYVQNDQQKKILKGKFINYGKPKEFHPRIALEADFRIDSNLFSIDKNVLTFKSGNYKIDRLLYIPSKYEVVFKPNTQIDFIHQGGLIINNSTRMVGNAKNKITFTSSDSTSMGITILQAKNVDIQYVDFLNQGNLNYHGWTLTGALSIYEATVNLSHLTIQGNRCEDALNLIRSNFTIESCTIEQTKGDAFDADFCVGTLTNCSFKNTGNDAVDFSDSRIQLKNCKMIAIGDKGISVGEGSRVFAKDVEINGCLTGMASKDGSILWASTVTINQAEVGVAIFMKKPQYTGSKMILTQVNGTKIGQNVLIEKGSRLISNGQFFQGTQKFDIEEMYARFGEK